MGFVPFRICSRYAQSDDPARSRCCFAVKCFNPEGCRDRGRGWFGRCNSARGSVVCLPAVPDRRRSCDGNWYWHIPEWCTGGGAGALSKRAYRQAETHRQLEFSNLEIAFKPDDGSFYLWNDNVRRIFEERNAQEFEAGNPRGIAEEELNDIIIEHGDRFEDQKAAQKELLKRGRVMLNPEAIDVITSAAQPYVREIGVNSPQARMDRILDAPVTVDGVETSLRSKLNELRETAASQSRELDEGYDQTFEELIHSWVMVVQRLEAATRGHKEFIDPLTGKPFTEAELLEQRFLQTGEESISQAEYEDRRGFNRGEVADLMDQAYGLLVSMAERFAVLDAPHTQVEIQRTIREVFGRRVADSPEGLSSTTIGRHHVHIPMPDIGGWRPFFREFIEPLSSREEITGGAPDLENTLGRIVERQEQGSHLDPDSEGDIDPSGAGTVVMNLLVGQEQRKLIRLPVFDELTAENAVMLELVAHVRAVGEETFPDEVLQAAGVIERHLPSYQTLLKRYEELGERDVVANPLSAEETAYKIALRRQVETLARALSIAFHELDRNVSGVGAVRLAAQRSDMFSEIRRLSMALGVNLPRARQTIIDDLAGHLVEKGEYKPDQGRGVYGPIFTKYEATNATRVVDIEGKEPSLQQKQEMLEAGISRYEEILANPEDLTLRDYQEEISFGIPFRIEIEPSQQEIVELFESRRRVFQAELDSVKAERAGLVQPVGARTRSIPGQFAYGPRGAYFFQPGMHIITIDPRWARESFEAKVWMDPKVEGVLPIGDENMFRTWFDWMDFVTEHEKAHARHRPYPDESVAEYENRINRIGLAAYRDNKRNLRMEGRVIEQAERLLEEARDRQNLLDPKPPPFDATFYHGTRSGDISSFVDNEGNLVLRSSSNFDGRQVGVSFSPRREVSEDYASRIAEDPSPRRDRAQGMVFEIDADALPEERMLEMDSTEFFAEGADDVVIPAGHWRVTRDAEAIRQRDTPLSGDADRIEELESRIDEYHEDMVYDFSEAEVDDLNEMRNELEVLRNRQPVETSEVDVEPSLDKVQNDLGQLDNLEMEIAQSHGMLQDSLDKLKHMDAVLRSVENGAELSDFSVAGLRLHVEDARIFLDQENYLEWQVDLQNEALSRIQTEIALEREIGQDLRPVSELRGIGQKLAGRLKNADIHTVSDLISFLTHGGNIRGIGVGTEKSKALLTTAIARLDVFEPLWERVKTIEQRRDSFRKEIIPLREEREKKLFDRLERGDPIDEAIALSVQRAIGGADKWLGKLFSTPEQRILNGSPFRESKRFYLKLVDANLLFDENSAGGFVNPYNVQNTISIGMSLATKALKNGPLLQWKYWLAGNNPDGTSKNLTPEVLNLRKVKISQTEFDELVGSVLHDKNYIRRVEPTIAPYVQAAADTMRSEFYLPMLHAWEKAYGGSPAHIDPLSYLMRLYKVQDILGKEKEFVERVYKDMWTKLEAKIRTRSEIVDEREIYIAQQTLREKIDKWLEAILTQPGSRLPEDDANPGRPTSPSSQGRPARARRAFEFRWYGPEEDTPPIDVTADFETLKPYLNLNVTEVTAVYTKTRLPDIALVSIFGDIKASKAFKTLNTEYQMKVQEIEQTVSPEKRDQALKELASAYASDKHDFEAIIDILRGVYNVPSDPYSFPAYAARAANVLKSVTYMRLGGSFGITALGDIGSSMLVNGLSRTASTLFEEFRSGFVRHIDSLPEKDLQHLLIDTEDYLHSRIGSIFDFDPWGPTPSTIEKAISVGATGMAHASLLMPWTNSVKHIGAKATIRKLAEVSTLHKRGSAPLYELAMMRSRGGLTDEDIMRIADLYDQYGTGQDGVGAVSLGVESWGTEHRALKDKVRKLIIADADRTAPAPRVGDKPIFMHKTAGSLLFMFKSFGFGLTSKLLIPALQGVPLKDYRVLNYIGVSVALGSLVYMLKEIVNKREIPDDIGRIIQEGVVRSDAWGKFTTVDEFSSVFTPMPSVLGTVGPDTMFGYEHSSWLTDALETVAGPALTTPVEMGRAVGGIVNAFGDPEGLGAATPQQIRALRKILPYQNLFYLDWLFDMYQNGLRYKSEMQRLNQIELQGNVQ